jgi:hypothetical protein
MMNKQSVALTNAGQTQQSPQLSPGSVINDNIPPPITPHTSTDRLPTPNPMDLSQDHPDEVMHSGISFAQAGMAPTGISIVMKEDGYKRGGKGGMNEYPRGYPSGRGHNRGGGGDGFGPACSHSSPSSGDEGQRVPYDNVTSPSLPPLPLHFSQLPHPNQQQQHGMDSMYYPPPRHISGAGPPP